METVGYKVSESLPSSLGKETTKRCLGSVIGATPAVIRGFEV